MVINKVKTLGHRKKLLIIQDTVWTLYNPFDEGRLYGIYGRYEQLTLNQTPVSRLDRPTLNQGIKGSVYIYITKRIYVSIVV